MKHSGIISKIYDATSNMYATSTLLHLNDSVQKAIQSHYRDKDPRLVLAALYQPSSKGAIRTIFWSVISPERKRMISLQKDAVGSMGVKYDPPKERDLVRSLINRKSSSVLHLKARPTTKEKEKGGIRYLKRSYLEIASNSHSKRSKARSDVWNIYEPYIGKPDAQSKKFWEEIVVGASSHRWPFSDEKITTVVIVSVGKNSFTREDAAELVSISPVVANEILLNAVTTSSSKSLQTIKFYFTMSNALKLIDDILKRGEETLWKTSRELNDFIKILLRIVESEEDIARRKFATLTIWRRLVSLSSRPAVALCIRTYFEKFLSLAPIGPVLGRSRLSSSLVTRAHKLAKLKPKTGDRAESKAQSIHALEYLADCLLGGKNIVPKRKGYRRTKEQQYSRLIALSKEREHDIGNFLLSADSKLVTKEFLAENLFDRAKDRKDTSELLTVAAFLARGNSRDTVLLKHLKACGEAQQQISLDYHITVNKRKTGRSISPFVLGVFSQKGGVGKSTIALGAATQFTSVFKRRTCIVELDFSGPTYYRYLSVSEDKRLEFLNDYFLKFYEEPRPQIKNLIRKFGGADFDVIPASPRWDDQIYSTTPLSGYPFQQAFDIEILEKLVCELHGKGYEAIIIDTAAEFKELSRSVAHYLSDTGQLALLTANLYPQTYESLLEYFVRSMIGVKAALVINKIPPLDSEFIRDRESFQDLLLSTTSRAAKTISSNSAVPTAMAKRLFGNILPVVPVRESQDIEIATRSRSPVAIIEQFKDQNFKALQAQIKAWVGK